MRLFDFLGLFDSSTNIQIYENDISLYEGRLDNVTQRVLNCRFVNKSMIENNALLIYTVIKSQDEMNQIDNEE